MLIPTGVIIVSGIVLQLKKNSAWIQPPTQKGSSGEPSLSFDQILATTQQVPEAEVEDWTDIDRFLGVVAHQRVSGLVLEAFDQGAIAGQQRGRQEGHPRVLRLKAARYLGEGGDVVTGEALGW